MTARLTHFAAAPEIMKAFFAFSTMVEASGLEKSLVELVKIRASQINGCANCLNLHTYEARQHGETEQRLAVLAALDAQFSKEEQVKLTMMIVVINGWNRLAIGFDLFDESLGWKE